MTTQAAPRPGSKRHTATLSAMHDYAQARSRNARAALSEIEALTDFALDPARMAAEIRATLQKLAQWDQESRGAFEAAGAAIDAHQYPDEA